MTDKNFKSYENEFAQLYGDVSLIPPHPLNWDDVMKVFRCTWCRWEGVEVVGGKEDCIDLGRESSDNTLEDLTLTPNGKYVFTIKGGSNNNHFNGVYIMSKPSVVDIEVGNWSTHNYEKSTGNRFNVAGHSDGSPVTYCYRLGCKVKFDSTSKVKHLWWRSIGLTFYWWFKYVWHVILKRHDNMGH